MSEYDPWSTWGEGRDEFPIRDMRYSCSRCHVVRAYSQGGICMECQRAEAAAMTEKELDD